MKTAATPTNPSKKILITGATGATGGNVLQELLKLNVPVRALVHSEDTRAEKLRAQGIEVVVGDLTDFDAVHAALEGITGAYFVYPIQSPGIVEATAFFAQAALEQGVGFIVNMSQISARRVAKSRAARDHWISERLLDRSGIPVAHLRPTFFAEWLLYRTESIRKGVLALPFGEAHYAPIAAEDQGRVIAAILNKPEGHAGKTYPLYGLEELTQHQTAAILSQVLERKVAYAPLEIDDFAQGLKELGYSAHIQQHLASVAQDCRDGVFSGMNDVVETITGQKPLGMAEYVTKHKALFL